MPSIALTWCIEDEVTEAAKVIDTRMDLDGDTASRAWPTRCCWRAPSG
jgi:hypothetical protein